MAIAGVGSVAASLSDGLAREGRTLLGGDVAFSLIQREAKPDEVAFLRSRGEVSRRGDVARDGARRRRPARAGRTQGGRWRLSDARRIDARAGNAAGRPAGRARRRVSARPPIRPCWRGSISSSATASPSAARRSKSAASSTREPDKLAGGLGLGPALPGQRSRPARHRIAAARQPGALDLPGEAAGQRGRRPRRDRADRRCAKRAAGSRLGNPQPRQRLAAARAHHQPLHPVPRRWSASPRCWSAASASPMPSRATSTAAATSSRRSRRSAPPAATCSRSI